MVLSIVNIVNWFNVVLNKLLIIVVIRVVIKLMVSYIEWCLVFCIMGVKVFLLLFKFVIFIIECLVFL